MQERQKNTQFCSVIILAAGKSSRMGSPKFALKFNKKYTFLEKIVQHYQNFGCKEIVVVLNKEGIAYLDRNSLIIDNNTILITNNHLEWERFYSIKLGMQSLTQQHPVFIHNVDNPFVNSEILESLLSQDSTADYVVPTYKGHGGHPILISNKVCKAIISEKEYDIILSNFLKRYDKKRVVVDDERVLVNINSKDLYQEYFR